MSEQIKYEAVFGNQSLFDEVGGDIVFVCFNSATGNYIGYGDGVLSSANKILVGGEIAMRRIIKTPVWTKADQLAGKLPEVGAEVIRVDHEDEGCNVIGEVIATWHCAENNESSQTCLRLKDGTLFLVECYSELRPIETPAEKAQRLRDEWCSECTSKYYPRGHKGFPEMIYDALLSGELPMPSKGGE